MSVILNPERGGKRTGYTSRGEGKLKSITERLYANMKKLQQPLNWLENYLDMAEGLLPVSVADFGISGLR
ncbi:hypothetical protein AQPE_0350 [Aquipluma nitroreducens]|uniref:Uncharacterized protein n=1 Tax=Aquipluma nitroreducens TaxID=2010828 RepID=A0A5K7S3U2_9BACT|nr:hypothetical protein [Aquipluma nitroreducens]BBE16213.1 hypothetical protein AQPE_0350 [Aquipluma nitroreducens]